METAINNNLKVLLDKKRLIRLEQKAAFLDELLSFIEDKYLGFLMRMTEGERSIPISEAKELLR